MLGQVVPLRAVLLPVIQIYIVPPAIQPKIYQEPIWGHIPSSPGCGFEAELEFPESAEKIMISLLVCMLTWRNNNSWSSPAVNSAKSSADSFENISLLDMVATVILVLHRFALRKCGKGQEKNGIKWREFPRKFEGSKFSLHLCEIPPAILVFVE